MQDREKLPIQTLTKSNYSIHLSVFLSSHIKCKVMNVRGSRNQGYQPLCLVHSCAVPLATGFGVRVTVPLVVILQRLLKADRALWFPGNAVESGTSNLSEECKNAMKHCGGLKAIS